MQANDFRQGSGFTIAEMTMHGIAQHFPQFLDGIALSDDGVTKCGGNKSAVHFVLTHFKNDLVHGLRIAQGMWTGKEQHE